MSETVSAALPYIFCILSGYLMGTVNFAWLIAKAKGFDIRTKGSNNAGTTNAGRTMGIPTGFLVLVCDICKSALMVWLAGSVFSDCPSIEAVMIAALVAGHMYPFYLEFKGGKGIAVMLGSALALDWRLMLVMLAGIGICIVITDYMFVGTLLAAVCYWVWFLVRGRDTVDLVLMFLMVAMVFWKHRGNFARLIAGKELGMRASFLKKKDQPKEE